MGKTVVIHACCLLCCLITACLAGDQAAAGEVEELRQAITEKGAHWTPGESWVTELSRAERQHLCGALLEPPDLSRAKLISLPQADKLPSHFDWRKNGGNWVTPPKDQGTCGSCWDFGAVAQVEAWWKIYYDNPDSMIDLSEQFILSCSEAGTCDGGGYPQLVLEFIRKNGVPLESCMRYQANDQIPCSRACSNWAEQAVLIPGCGYITIGEADIANIKNAILRQPLCTGYIVYEDFFSYSTGVYEHVSDLVAGPHAIIIIGWDDGEQCWICKNSWGTEWGETADFKPYTLGAENGGYFRIRWGECEIGNYSFYIYDNLTGGPALATTPQQLNLELIAGDSLVEFFSIHNHGQEPLQYVSYEYGGEPLFHSDSFMAFDDLSWWCGLPQIGGYQNGWLQFLDTLPLDLSGTYQPHLEWMGAWALEDTAGIGEFPPFDGWDGCNVWISTDGGETFTIAEPLYPRYTSRCLWSFGSWWGMGENIPGWGGSSGGWRQIEYDLSPYRSDSVVVRFAFAADGGQATPDDPLLYGFFVDEIVVTDGAAVLFENHGEDDACMTACGELQQPAAWIKTIGAAGTLASGESATAQLIVGPHDLEPGGYLGRVAILSNDTTTSMYNLPVKLKVQKPSHDVQVQQHIVLPAQVPLCMPLHPVAMVKNQGLTQENNFTLVCSGQVGGRVICHDVRSIDSLPVGSEKTVPFAPFSFTEVGQANVTMTLADAPQDYNRYNNKVVSSLDVTHLIDGFVPFRRTANMTIDNPIEMLTHEHGYILKVVHGLSVIDDELNRGASVDVGRIQRAVQFMRNFADKCHHAKEEDVLFPAMEDKGVPKTGCPLGALRAEHEKGRKIVTALKEAADAYAVGREEAAENLRMAIAEIRQLYPNHIWKEDEMAFPMAQRLFTRDELIRLKVAFDEAESEYGKDLVQYVTFADEMERLLGIEGS